MKKSLWLATVEHVSVPGISAAMFFQAAMPSDRAIKRRFAALAKPSELIVSAVLDLSHITAHDEASRQALIASKPTH